MEPRVRLRVSFSAHEIELDGPETFVRDFWSQLEELRAEFATPQGVNEFPARQNGSGLPSNSGTSDRGREMPAEFGEYLQSFRNGITDVDRILVAASFAQESSGEENVFMTKDVNQLLISQGVKVANASEGVRRNVSNRRAFSIGNGKYRISHTGWDYLSEIKSPSGDE